jgi:hypothetical protein
MHWTEIKWHGLEISVSEKEHLSISDIKSVEQISCQSGRINFWVGLEFFHSLML